MADIIIPKASETPLALTASYAQKADWFFWDKLPELQVYVEDEEDRPFWYKLFSCLNSERRVSISVLKRESRDAIVKRKEGNDELHGKDVLMRVPDLSDRKVVAVDADYDLLVDQHDYSQRVRDDKFVIHTEYYSIENHLLNSKSIYAVSIWQPVSEFITQIDWNNALNTLAQNLSDAVKLCIASIGHRQELYHQGISPLPDTFSVKEIITSLGDISFKPDNYKQSISTWRTNIEHQPHYKTKLKECAEEMKDYSGWKDEDVLHNLQGHTLYKFVSPIMTVIFNKAYKQLVEKEKSVVEDKTQMSEVIRKLNQRIGICGDFIKDSIYNASSLDMSDKAIERIQNKIRAILD